MSYAWHYAQDGKALGPVGEPGLRALIVAGTVTPETLVWRNGLAGWEPAGQHLSFAPPAPMPPEVEAAAEDQSSGPRYTEPTGRTPGDWVARARAKAAADGPWQDQTQGTAQTRAATGGWSSGAGSSARLGPDGLYIGAPSRGPIEAILVCLSKFVSFSGRASRSEYWWFMVACGLFNVPMSLFAGLGLPSVITIGGLFSLVLVLPMIAVTVRRLHDIDRSGWWVAGSFLTTVLSGFASVSAIIAAMSSTSDPEQALAAMKAMFLVIYGITGLYGVLMFVFLCSRGTPGPNRFG
ncbi:uncharacterized membrane protein YhaH (DUF805 family) [Rhodobacter viridis]|uniref:Uncharacterized membrane protein YhaH (DUF805 family) n=1 Tax=Rhodobacter viridis TaxID=1054202 RepID=A0A318U8N7_9RHOB|nr:DUF805 domain-containing protein [Rhodobacter viridis]PYF11235.1 uncharacterized membrane protein YhaH (DUF805 family) [Rhodobacter viridis]